MMKKRVDREFRKYSVKNAICFSMNAINISSITNDKGDCQPDSIYDFEPYDYEQESEEPAPPKVDAWGVTRKL